MVVESFRKGDSSCGRWVMIIKHQVNFSFAGLALRPWINEWSPFILRAQNSGFLTLKSRWAVWCSVFLFTVSTGKQIVGGATLALSSQFTTATDVWLYDNAVPEKGILHAVPIALCGATGGLSTFVAFVGIVEFKGSTSTMNFPPSTPILRGSWVILGRTLDYLVNLVNMFSRVFCNLKHLWDFWRMSIKEWGGRPWPILTSLPCYGTSAFHALRVRRGGRQGAVEWCGGGMWVLKVPWKWKDQHFAWTFRIFSNWLYVGWP